MNDLHLHTILQETFDFNGIEYDIDLVRMKSRKMEIIVMKKMACIALKQAGLSFHQIGRFLNLSHCTVVHHCLHSKWARGYDITFPTNDYNSILVQISIYEQKIIILKAKLQLAKRTGTKIGETDNFKYHEKKPTT